MVIDRAAKDAILVERYRAGDREALGELVREYEGAALAVALSCVHERDVAADIVQDAFVAVCRELPRLREPTAFGPWLRAIVRTHALEWRRRSTRMGGSTDERGGAVHLDRISLRNHASRESVDEIMAAVYRLPEHQRDVVLMYYLNDFSYREIAEFLDLPVSTVDSRLQKARVRLKEDLGHLVRKDRAMNHARIRKEVQDAVKGVRYREALERLVSHAINEVGEDLPETERTALAESVGQIMASVQVADPTARREDWGEAPDVLAFYGRETEQATLAEWIDVERCRLVAVLGMGGMGKTALAAKVAEQVAGGFDLLVWRSLVNAPPLDELLSDLVGVFTGEYSARPSEPADKLMARVLEQLGKKRCLVILDNAESLLTAEHAGVWRSGYEGYGLFLRRLGESRHGSAVILTSREKPREFARMEGPAATSLVRVLNLGGLDGDAGRDLVRSRDIAGDDAAGWDRLVAHYSGNPLALTLVAGTIAELYGGDLAAFLAEGLPIFDDVRALLDSQVDRLPALERDLLFWLAIEREAVPADVLADDLAYPAERRDVLEALRNLRLRSLVEQDAVGFHLQNVITEYATDRLVAALVAEIEGGRADLFDRHALAKATAKTYIREAQERLLLAPVAERAVKHLGQAGMEAKLRAMLDDLAESETQHAGPEPTGSGYAAGNAIKLVAHTKGEVVGWDFSFLPIRSAYLAGVEVHDTSFAGAKARRCSYQLPVRDVSAIAISPDGLEIAVGSQHRIDFWSYPDLAHLKSVDTPRWSIVWLSYAADGMIYAGGYGSSEIWDARSGKVVVDLGGGTLTKAFSHDGRLTASYDPKPASDGTHRRTLRIYETDTGRLKVELPGPEGVMRALAFSPDDRRVAAVGDFTGVWVWDIERGVREFIITGLRDMTDGVAFSHDGRILAFGLADRKQVDIPVYLYDTDTWEYIREFPGHEGFIRSLDFSADDSMIAVGTGSGFGSGKTHVWKTATGEKLMQFECGRRAVFTPDGTRIIANGGRDVALVYDLSTGNCEKRLSGSQRHTVPVISPNGRHVAGAIEDRGIWIWDIPTGDVRARIRAGGEPVAFNADGTLMVAGGKEASIRRWSDGSLVRNLEPTNFQLMSIAISRDGRLVTAGTSEGMLVAWDAESGNTRFAVRAAEWLIRAVAFARNDAEIISGGGNGVLTVWDAATGQLVRSLKPFSGHIHSIALTDDQMYLAVNDWGYERIPIYRTDTYEVIAVVEARGQRGIRFDEQNRLLVPFGAVRNGPSGIRVFQIDPVSEITSAGFSIDRAGWVFTDSNTVLMGLWDEREETCTKWEIWDVAKRQQSAILQIDPPYARLNIFGTTGLTEGERATLLELGAIEKDVVPARVPAITPRPAGDTPAELRDASARLADGGFRSWVGASKAILALVFTDVVGSTALANRLGNERMSEVRRAHFDRGRALIREHGGYEVKTIGDAFMVAFRTAVEALDFALAFHGDPGAPEVAIRAGVHIGLVDVEEDDAYGPMVNFTARVESRAEGAAIFASDEVRAQVTAHGSERHASLAWTSHPNCRLKGFPRRFTLWSVEKPGD